MTNSRGPQQLTNCIVQSRVHYQRDQFIASIADEDVLHLAASYRNGKMPKFFQPPARGSYNICYFVQFQPSHANTSNTSPNCLSSDEQAVYAGAEKWVIRVPLRPCLAFPAKIKLESEIATMRLVAEKTTIPIPKVLAYAIDDNPQPLSTFLILEYIEGKKFSFAQLKELQNEQQRSHLYTSLADIYIQLRRLEFPSIGCLIHGPDGLKVHQKIASIDINMQELEGLQPSRIQTSRYKDDGILKSADSYVDMLLQIADNAFLEGQNSVIDADMGEDYLYHLHLFRQYAKGWVDHDLDQGPFVLVHGDLEPFNLLMNENMDIVAVLDWEWSRVVPRQLFNPPLWLKYADLKNLAYPSAYDMFLDMFKEFLATVRARERERYGNELLADEWLQAKENGGFLIANALENWTYMDWVAHRYIDRKLHKGNSDLEKRVQTFMDEDSDRAVIVARKVREGIAYKAELAQREDLRGERNSDVVEAKSNRKACPSLRAFLRYFCLQSRKSTLPRLGLGSLALLVAGTSYLLWKCVFRMPFLGWPQRQL